MGCNRGWDLAWLWLWCRLAATALFQPLDWEPPYAVGVALKKKKKRIHREESYVKMCEDGGRSWSNVATSQGIARAWESPSEGRGEGGFFSRSFGRSIASSTP